MSGWLGYYVVVVMLFVGACVIRHILHRPWPPLVIHPVVCEGCGKGFKSSHVLTWHLKAEHQQLWGPFKPQLDMLKGRGFAVQSQQAKTTRKRKPKLKVVR